MAAKVDPSSSSESQRVQSMISVSSSPNVSAQAPKVSKFSAKSGFVIPKNKLSGSLVPIFRTAGKVEGRNTVNEESTKQIQRKTRWGHDLTQDAAVRKGKALAYQTRLEQINQQLTGALFKDNEDSESLKEAIRNGSSNEAGKDMSSKRKLLELEKREVIGEILRLNPTYKAPADYKPLQKEGKVPIPIKAYPGYNFIGLFLGPTSSTQKRLEEETGAKVRLYGIKKEADEKHEITQLGTRESQDAYEELYVNISADTYEKVDAAIALIELLLKPLSGNAGVSSTNSISVTGNSATLVDPSQTLTSSYTVMPMVDVNQGIAQPMSVVPLPGQMQYQTYASSWYPSAPVANPLAPSTYMQSSVPNNFAHFQSSPLRPHVQAMQHPLNQPALSQNHLGLQLPLSSPVPSSSLLPMAPASRPMQIVSQPAPPSSSQPVAISPYSSIRPLAMPLTPPVGTSGWSPVPQLGLPSQRLNVPSLSGQVMRHNLAVSLPPMTNMPTQVGGKSPVVITSQPLPPNLATTIASDLTAANFARPPSLPGQQMELNTFPSVHLQTARPFASHPMPLQMHTPAPRPLTVLAHNPGPSLLQSPFASNIKIVSTFAVEKPVLSISPSVPVRASRSAQPVVVSSERPDLTPVVTPGSTPSFFPAVPGATTVSNSVPTIAAPRPLGPASGDFTFQPLRGSVPAPPGPAGSSSQIVQQTTAPLRAPQLPSFRPTVQAPAPVVNSQSFGRPLLAHANPPQVSMLPPPSSVPFSVRPTVNRPQPSFSDLRSAHLAGSTQIRPPNYASVSQVLNRPGSLPIHYANPVRPHLNQLPPAVRPGNNMIRGPQLINPPGSMTGKVSPNPGGNQVYDPFSPTSFSSASKVHGDDPGRKPESDSEYDDLMASVGVK